MERRIFKEVVIGLNSLSWSLAASFSLSTVDYGRSPAWAQAAGGAWQSQSMTQLLVSLQQLLQSYQALSNQWSGLLGGQAHQASGAYAAAGTGTSAYAGAGFAGGYPPANAGFGSGAYAGSGFGGGYAVRQPAGGYANGSYAGAGWGAYAGGWGQAAPMNYQDAQQFAASLALNYGYQEVPGQQQKMWDVWFDSKAGQNTVQRSPLVLDLNKNGKADITGKNITGDGKIDGPTTMFDLDPNQVSYEFKSQQRRPGSGAPAVDGGYWVDTQGNRVKSGPPKGNQPKFNGYQYMDKDGKLVGEMKDGLYHYGKQEKREATEWLAKDGGDGFLVADLNGDGEINSAVELFGTEGSNGQKFQNGYEKLAAMYDRNRDGKVTGEELKGLQIWADSNADGKVQEGELQSLAQHDISSLDVANYDRQSMEGSFNNSPTYAPYFNLAAALATSGFGQQSYPLSHPYFPQQPYGLPPFAG